MGLDPDHKPIKRVPSSPVRAIAVAFAILLVGCFLLPLKQWWDLSATDVLPEWASLLWAVAGGLHFHVYLFVGLILVMVTLSFAEAVGEIADAANLSFTRLTLRVICVLPFTLLPLIASAAVVHSAFLSQWVRRQSTMSVLEHHWSQSLWATLDVLVPCFIFFLAVVSAATGLGIMWWSCVEQLKTTPIIEGQSRNVPNLAVEFTAIPLLLGGFVGCGIAARMFGRPAPTREIRIWMKTVAGAAILFAVVVHFYLIRRSTPPLRQERSENHRTQVSSD